MATMVIQCGCVYCDYCTRLAVNFGTDRILCGNNSRHGELSVSTFFTVRFNERYSKVRIPVRTFKQLGLPWTVDHTLKPQWTRRARSPVLRVDAEEYCTICYEALGDVFQNCSITCVGASVHIFHTACLARYFRDAVRRSLDMSCPLCRAATRRVFTTGQWFYKSQWYIEEECFGDDQEYYVTWLQFNEFHPVAYPRVTQSRRQERDAEIAYQQMSEEQAQEELRRRNDEIDEQQSVAETL